MASPATKTGCLIDWLSNFTFIMRFRLPFFAWCYQIDGIDVNFCAEMHWISQTAEQAMCLEMDCTCNLGKRIHDTFHLTRNFHIKYIYSFFFMIVLVNGSPLKINQGLTKKSCLSRWNKTLLITKCKQMLMNVHRCSMMLENSGRQPFSHCGLVSAWHYFSYRPSIKQCLAHASLFQLVSHHGTDSVRDLGLLCRNKMLRPVWDCGGQWHQQCVPYASLAK